MGESVAAVYGTIIGACAGWSIACLACTILMKRMNNRWVAACRRASRKSAVCIEMEAGKIGENRFLAQVKINHKAALRVAVEADTPLTINVLDSQGHKIEPVQGSDAPMSTTVRH